MIKDNSPFGHQALVLQISEKPSSISEKPPIYLQGCKYYNCSESTILHTNY